MFQALEGIKAFLLHGNLQKMEPLSYFFLHSLSFSFGMTCFVILPGNIFSNYLKGIKLNEKALDLLKKEADTKSLPSLKEVEKIIGYSFNNPNLLHQAFTHPTYQKNCVSYERLEYVGDSVLNLLITKEQLFMYPDLPPGLLSPLRAANVDTEKLARVAVKHNFHKYVRYGNPGTRKKVCTWFYSNFCPKLNHYMVLLEIHQIVIQNF